MNIAIIEGDGTGPEVIREAVKVLKAVCAQHRIPLSLEYLPINGTRYLEKGALLSDEEIQHLQTKSAVLLGAIGHPHCPPGVLERGILLRLRFALDLYINLRPVKRYPSVTTPLRSQDPLDYVVVRENSGGLYTGVGGRSMVNTPHEVAVESMVYNYTQVERCIRYAFELATRRHAHQPWQGLTDDEKKAGKIGKVTLCGKSNVLTHVFALWQRVMDEIKDGFPRIVTDYVHVDAMCIYMIECPQRFDVIVTENMFGDIITDLAAVTQGGMGVASSGNINPYGVSMFEPIGGTAPDWTGKNQINPIAAIGAVQMMMDHLGHIGAAHSIEKAKAHTVAQMTSMIAGEMGYSTSEVGDMVVDALAV